MSYEFQVVNTTFLDLLFQIQMAGKVSVPLDFEHVKGIVQRKLTGVEIRFK
jgi:hypothetical protein